MNEMLTEPIQQNAQSLSIHKAVSCGHGPRNLSEEEQHDDI